MLKKICALAILCLGLLPAAAAADVVINELMASNGLYEDGKSYDWVELYNDGDKAVDLSGWFFSDSKKDLQKFVFPKGTKLAAGGYLTVFCTGEDGIDPGKGKTFYSSFSLSGSGETLYLSDPEGTLVTKLKYPEQFGNVTWGVPYGGGEPGFMENITRNAKNDDAAYTARTETPAILTAGGFYAEGVTVQAQVPEGAILRYTTNGDTPDAKDKEFPAEGLLIKKTTPLRIRAFREGEVSSVTVSATYIVEDEQLTPIVSLVSDDRYFFSNKDGALVKGSGKTPNYNKDYEYPVNIEYYNGEGVCELNQMGTFTCAGNTSRLNPQKAIALYARKPYGKASFEFNPFPIRDYTEYKSLMLRAAGSDVHALRMRDILASSLAEGEGLLYQDYVIIQVYINGEYWGHYNLREKINKHFVAQYEGVTDENDIDNITLMTRSGADRYVQNGDNTEWLELADFCRNNDLNIPENLAYVEERLDIDNMFTHAIYEMVTGNMDPGNVRIYRVPGGKWKYLLYDIEAVWRNLETTPIEYYIKPVSAKVGLIRHEPLNALLEVPEYRTRFLHRVAEILEDHFQWPYLEEKFDNIIAQMEPIMPRHIKRWKNMTMVNWNKNIGATKYYARVRSKKIIDMISDAMDLTKEEHELYFGEIQRLLEVTNAPQK